MPKTVKANPNEDQEQRAQDEPLWDQNDTATYLKTAPRTVEGWRYRGGGPPYLMIQNRPRYVPSLVRDWAMQKLRNTGSAAAA